MTTTVLAAHRGRDEAESAAGLQVRGRAWPPSRTACTRGKSIADEDGHKLARFLKASLKLGLRHQNQPEAVNIVLERRFRRPDQARRPPRSWRSRLVEGGKLGFLEPKSYDRTVATAHGQVGSVINKKPAGAWTHKIWEAAQK
jgi:hypothetical protein